MANPEIQFRMKYKPDYTGMDLAEYTFCEMEDYTGEVRPYRLDIITRAGCVHIPTPVILFIHGGGFIEPCDKRQAYISTFARTLTERGYTVVSPDYPLFADEKALELAGGEAVCYQKPAEAIHLAYQYLCSHAKELGLDMTRVGIMGGSAGGCISFYAIAGYTDTYRAQVNLWGAPQNLPDVSAFPPVLSVHGTADPMVSYQREMPLQDKLEQAGIPHKLISLEGSGHTPLNRLDEFLPDILTWLDTYVMA